MYGPSGHRVVVRRRSDSKKRRVRSGWTERGSHDAACAPSVGFFHHSHPALLRLQLRLLFLLLCRWRVALTEAAAAAVSSSQGCQRQVRSGQASPLYALLAHLATRCRACGT